MNGCGCRSLGQPAPSATVRASLHRRAGRGNFCAIAGSVSPPSLIRGFAPRNDTVKFDVNSFRASKSAPPTMIVCWRRNDSVRLRFHDLILATLRNAQCALSDGRERPVPLFLIALTAGKKFGRSFSPSICCGARRALSYAAAIVMPSCSQELATSQTVARCMSRFQRKSSKSVPRCIVQRLSQITRSCTRQRWV